jgi:hypothetical protein
VRLLVAAFAVLAAWAPVAGAGCLDQPGDAAAVAGARAAIAAACDCAAAANHTTYLRCARTAALLRVGASSLPRRCLSTVMRCAAQSICGRPGAVTCCVTNHAQTRCHLERNAGKCVAPKTGSACVGSVPSCCDACAAGSCATTPTTTVTTTTLPAAPCADGFGVVCSGSCPPAERCVDGANGVLTCGCVPAGATACGESAFPQCGGVCAGNRKCQATVLADVQQQFTVCLCVDPAVPCGPNQCAEPGACPSGQFCDTFGFEAPVECNCLPLNPSTTTTVSVTTTTSTTIATPCANLMFPQCNGTCPAGSHCAGDLASGFCSCYPAGVTACGESAYPTCGGSCLGTKTCQAVRTIIPALSLDVRDCECLAPAAPCGPNVCPAGPGVCPPGKVCSGFATSGPLECNCVNP